MNHVSFLSSYWLPLINRWFNQQVSETLEEPVYDRRWGGGGGEELSSEVVESILTVWQYLRDCDSQLAPFDLPSQDCVAQTSGPLIF